MTILASRKRQTIARLGHIPTPVVGIRLKWWFATLPRSVHIVKSDPDIPQDESRDPSPPLCRFVACACSTPSSERTAFFPWVIQQLEMAFFPAFSRYVPARRPGWVPSSADVERRQTIAYTRPFCLCSLRNRSARSSPCQTERAYISRHPGLDCRRFSLITLAPWKLIAPDMVPFSA